MTMATHTEAKPGSHALVLVHDAKRTPAQRPASIFRLAVPLIYMGMGISLGTLTGVGIAFMTVPARATVSPNDLTSVVSSSANLGADSQIPPAGRGTQRPAGLVRVGVKAGKINSAIGPVRADQAAKGSSASKGEVKENQTLPNQAEPNKAPIVEQSPPSPAAPATKQPGKRDAHPVVAPVNKILANVPDVEPVPLDANQLSAENDAKPSDFYSEGDMTVANYDAAGGTIETSDGRVFVVGQTVSVSNATSWEDYRSSVHYRCGEDGSCTLVRDGAIAPNAKLVQTI
jgi:hypothetical protein